MAGTPVLTLLLTVFESILEVFLLCLAGWFLAKKQILDKKTQKQLNRINVSLFTPSLLFSKVAFFLSPEKLKELWIIPLFFVLVTLISMGVAEGMSRALRLKKTQKNFAVASSMFMNSNSLPIALMQSLVITVPHLQWGDDDSQSAMLGRALTYLVLYSTLGMILRWSYGVHLLSQADDINEGIEAGLLPTTDAGLRYTDEESTMQPESLIGNETTRGKQAERSETPILVDTSVSGNDEEAITDLATGDPQIQVQGPSLTTREQALHRGKVNPVSHMFYSFPNTPLHSQDHLADLNKASNHDYRASDEDDDASEALRFSPRSRKYDSNYQKSISSSRFGFRIPVPLFLQKLLSRLSSFWRSFNDFMTVPLWASLASIVVACVPPLQHAIEEHTTPLKGALSQAGSCSIPVTLVVLGAYFYVPKDEERPKDEDKHKRDAGCKLGDEETGKNTSQAGNTVPTPNLSTSTLQSNVGSLSSNHPNAFRLRSSPSNATSIPNSDRPPHRRQTSLLSARRDAARPGETKTVFVAILSRMVLTPLLLFPFVLVSAIYDWHYVFQDPVFVVCMVLLSSAPPALTLAQITQKVSGEAFERLLSRTIFWAYCILTPPATIGYVVLGLWLAKL